MQELQWSPLKSQHLPRVIHVTQAWGKPLPQLCSSVMKQNEIYFTVTFFRQGITCTVFSSSNKQGTSSKPVVFKPFFICGLQFESHYSTQTLPSSLPSLSKAVTSSSLSGKSQIAHWLQPMSGMLSLSKALPGSRFSSSSCSQLDPSQSQI